MSVEARIEADELALWFHLNSPEDNAQVAAMLTDSLAEAKRAWMAAHAVRDAAAEARAVAEWQDIIVLLGAASDGLADERRRFEPEPKPRPVVFIDEYPGR